MLKASVSEIHLWRRCPRLLAYHLRGWKEAWKAGLPGSASWPGSFFHDRLAAPFHRSVASGADSVVRRTVAKLLAGPEKEIEEGLARLVEERFFVPALKKRGKGFTTAQMIQLAEGVKDWIGYLGRFLIRAKGVAGPGGPVNPEDLFHDPEAPLAWDFRLENGETFRVAGRYDALLLDRAAGEAVVLEFKGRAAGETEEDFLQLALYGRLVGERTGVAVRGAVIYLEGDRRQTEYSSEEMARAMEDLPRVFEEVARVMEVMGKDEVPVLPPPRDSALCPRCPFDGRCDGDWGLREPGRAPSAGPPFPAEPVSRDDAEAEEKQRALMNALRALKLSVEPGGYISGPRFIRFKVRPLLEKGATVRKLASQSENLQVALELAAAPLIQPQAGYVSVDVPRRVQTPLTLGEVWRRGRINRPDSPVAFPLGMAIDGSIVWADLSDPTMTSVLVGGTSGSGKSVFLRSAAVSLALHASPRDLRLTLVDPKRVSFNDLASLPHLDGPVLMDAEPALERLEDLAEEMEYRYRLFEKRGAPDILAYNVRGSPLSHQVVIIDEYGDLMVDKAVKEETERAVQRLGQKGRAAGVHLVLATQRPDSKVVTPLIKANLQLKIALKVTTATNSSVILDQTGAEYLVGCGDMLVGGSVPVQRLQGPLVTRTDIEEALNSRI